MASFVENFRRTGFQKIDPINEQRRQKADFSGFENAIKSGTLANSPERQEKELRTLQMMDSIYNNLAESFFEKMRSSYGSIEGALKAPMDETVKASEDFITQELPARGLDSTPLPNGKSFVYNFRKYGYDPDLLSGWNLNTRLWSPAKKSTEYFPEVKTPMYFPAGRPQQRV